MLTDDQLAAAGVDIEHHFIADEVYSKRTSIKAGASLGKHTHPFDHASALISGTVLLVVNGVKREITGPRMLLIEANKEHAIHALTDVVWHCLHITSDTDPASVDATILKG
jgi:quercetin dioxygenase-like cupin family protein